MTARFLEDCAALYLLSFAFPLDPDWGVSSGRISGGSVTISEPKNCSVQDVRPADIKLCSN